MLSRVHLGNSALIYLKPLQRSNRRGIVMVAEGFGRLQKKKKIVVVKFEMPNCVSTERTGGLEAH